VHFAVDESGSAQSANRHLAHRVEVAEETLRDG
jgi:hypothetical protein